MPKLSRPLPARLVSLAVICVSAALAACDPGSAAPKFDPSWQTATPPPQCEHGPNRQRFGDWNVSFDTDHLTRRVITPTKQAGSLSIHGGTGLFGYRVAAAGQARPWLDAIWEGPLRAAGFDGWLSDWTVEAVGDNAFSRREGLAHTDFGEQFAGHLAVETQHGVSLALQVYASSSRADDVRELLDDVQRSFCVTPANENATLAEQVVGRWRQISEDGSAGTFEDPWEFHADGTVTWGNVLGIYRAVGNALIIDWGTVRDTIYPEFFTTHRIKMQFFDYHHGSNANLHFVRD